MEDAQTSKVKPYAYVINRLYQGPLYSDELHYWKGLQDYRHQIRDRFEEDGLELHVDEQEGFAYITQLDMEDTNGNKVTRLVKRIPLSYEITLLLVILRECLEEFDFQNDGYSTKLFLTDSEIKDRIRQFFRERYNEIKLLNQIDKYINQVVDLGFLKKLKDETSETDAKSYEVKRIIKAKISNQTLQEIKERLNLLPDENI
ncbi:MAG: DUF4194 domain-containing protein [Desulfobacterales bacterium]|nr:DUF4194 domain-containing protein [Desulfobacterales bacterium]